LVIICGQAESGNQGDVRKTTAADVEEDGLVACLDSTSFRKSGVGVSGYEISPLIIPIRKRIGRVA
jgi:hypothetical protein